MTSQRFLLHANQFTERGDSVTLMSVAKGLKDELGLESVIAFPKDAAGNNEQRIREAQRVGLELFQYRSRSQLEEMCLSSRLTHNYVISDGSLTGVSYSRDRPSNFRLRNLRHITQVVFRKYQPHGDAYMYISEWLYNWGLQRQKSLSGALEKTFSLRHVNHEEIIPNLSCVPHIVEHCEGDGPGFRKKYGIPNHAKLIGRIGGFDQFSDSAAQVGLVQTLESKSDLFAAMVNTRPFTQHDRVTYIPFLSRDEIWDFYAACDVLLNGRKMGESFGFSIVEALAAGKPVIGPALRRNIRMDQHHIALLKDFDLLYSSSQHLSRLIIRELDGPTDPDMLRFRVQAFRQSAVMENFRRTCI